MELNSGRGITNLKINLLAIRDFRIKKGLFFKIFEVETGIFLLLFLKPNLATITSLKQFLKSRKYCKTKKPALTGFLT